MLFRSLMKPCDVATLKATLTRVCTLDEFLSNEKLKALVARLEVLPSLPSLYFKILQELQSPFASIDRIGEIVALDLGMTAKLLQMVNSAFFGISRKISDPTEAVQLLGMGTVRSLAISIHAFSCFDPAKLAEFSFERLWDHSVVTGLFARKIAQWGGSDRALADEAFIAGLLHDIGKLMMISSVMEPYRSAWALAREKRITLWEAEQEVFGATHADVGAYLLGLWGLPIPVVEAVALHHNPSRNVNWEFSPLTAVHVANVLEHERSSAPLDGSPSRFDENYLTQLGVWEELPRWREILNESLQPRDR